MPYAITRPMERVPQSILENWLLNPLPDFTKDDMIEVVTELQTREREKNLSELDTQEANAVDDMEWIE